jgi:hypothetical protein
MVKYHRGERRYQRRRMIEKFFEQELRDRLSIDVVRQTRWALRSARLRTTCRTLCSCWGCCSPRKFHGNGKAGLTLQEIRLLARLKDES